MTNSACTNNIVLIGMPGSGKTTIGKLLAAKLNYEFIDTDELIANKTGKTPRQIVEDNGLEEFIKIQDQVVFSINQRNSIISTGGGIVHSEPAMNHLKSIGLVIYLNTNYDIIEKRMDKSRKLVRTGGSLVDLYNIRVPLYSKYADIILNCDESNPDFLCNNIIKTIASEF